MTLSKAISILEQNGMVVFPAGDEGNWRVWDDILGGSTYYEVEGLIDLAHRFKDEDEEA